MSRPTPETDAFAVKFKSVCGSKAWVPADICRRFERERDEAMEAARTLAEHGESEIQKLIKERDEAREALNRITEAANAVVDRWEQPSWKDTEPTALVIYKLRSVLKEQNK